ncbi:MAG: hypothetical protein OXG88_03705 [Gammaproteobacteria bacterium]|nr:hypothetical protein [Gammaproteobacteria bacterium]
MNIVPGHLPWGYCGHVGNDGILEIEVKDDTEKIAIRAEDTLY